MSDAADTPAPKKRRLKVLNNPDDTPVRPGWQWAGIGAVLVILIWVFFAGAIMVLFGGAQAKTVTEAGAQMVLQSLLHLFAMALAGILGGYVVGRFGTPSGRREGAQAGILVAIVATVTGLVNGLSGTRLLVTMVIVGTVLVVTTTAGATLGERFAKAP